MKSFRRMLRDESGITTIEWVAITAVAMLAAFGISNMILQGADRLGGSVADRMSDAADSVDGDNGGGGGGNGNRGGGGGRR